MSNPSAIYSDFAQLIPVGIAVIQTPMPPLDAPADADTPYLLANTQFKNILSQVSLNKRAISIIDLNEISRNNALACLGDLIRDYTKPEYIKVNLLEELGEASPPRLSMTRQRREGSLFSQAANYLSDIDTNYFQLSVQSIIFEEKTCKIVTLKPISAELFERLEPQHELPHLILKQIKALVFKTS